MRTKIWTTAALLAGFAGAAWGQNIGGQSAPWTRISTDTRSAAMGGALVALTNDTEALESNPAGLGLITGPMLDFSHNIWVEGLSMEHAAFGMKASDFGFAAAANYLDFGSVQEFSVGPQGIAANGSISPQAMDFSVGGGMAVVPSLLYAGITAEWLGQNLTSSWDSAFQANLGLLYKDESGLSAGVALTNLGSNLDGYSLPLQVATGAAYTFKDLFPQSNGVSDSVAAAGQWNYLPNSSLSNFSLGGEYWYQQKVAVRGGYNFSDYGTTDTVHGLTLGLGLHLDKIDLSYAWVTLGNLGVSNQFALAYAL